MERFNADIEWFAVIGDTEAMPRYADHECNDCGVVLPSNELYRISDQVRAYTSRSRGIRTGVHGGVGFSGSTRDTYKIRQLEVCPECYSERKSRARWAALRRLFGWAIVIGVGVAIAINVANRPHSANANLTSNDATSAGNATGLTINEALPIDTPSPTATEDEKPSLSVSPSSTAPDAVEPPSSGDALLDATKRALGSGRSVAWRNGEEHGFVSVSTPQTYPDRICRNVYFTTDTHGDEVRSPNRVWCQPSNGGDWNIQPSEP